MRIIRRLWRWIRGATIFYGVMLAGLVYLRLVQRFSLGETDAALGMFALALFLWPTVSALRFRFRF